MTVKTKSGATYDDLMKVPDTFVAEIVEGDLFASPRPGGRHSLASSVLAGELVPPFHHGRHPGPGGWWKALGRRRKRPVYAREGVDHVWLINPASRTLEIFRRSGAGWVLVTAFAEDEVVRAEPFDAIELDLLLLWGERRTG